MRVLLTTAAAALCLELGGTSVGSAQQVPAAPDAGPGESSGAAPLERVALGRVGVEAEVDAVASAGAWGRFDPDAWALALKDSDLEKREAAFEGLVDRASCDAAVEAWLRGTARSGLDPELAWAARLALRELEQECVRVDPERGAGLFVTPSVVIERHWLEEIQDLSRRYRRLFLEIDPSVFAAPGGAFFLSPMQGVPMGVAPVAQPAAGASASVAEVHVDRSAKRLELRVRTSDVETPSVRGGLRMDVLGVLVAQVSAEHGASLGLPAGQGLVVEHVVPGTLAWFFGLQPGDVLEQLGGVVLKEPDDLTRALAQRAPGKGVSLRWRDGRGRTRSGRWSPVETGRREKPQPEAEPGPEPAVEDAAEHE